MKANLFCRRLLMTFIICIALIIYSYQLLIVYLFDKCFNVLQVHGKVVVNKLQLLLSGLVSVFIQILFEGQKRLGRTEFQNQLLNSNQFHTDEGFSLRNERVYLLIADVSDNLVVMFREFMRDNQALKILYYLSSITNKTYIGSL